MKAAEEEAARIKAEEEAKAAEEEEAAAAKATADAIAEAKAAEKAEREAARAAASEHLPGAEAIKVDMETQCRIRIWWTRGLRRLQMSSSKDRRRSRRPRPLDGTK